VAVAKEDSQHDKGVGGIGKGMSRSAGNKIGKANDITLQGVNVP